MSTGTALRILGGIALSAIACAPATKIVASWKDPGAQKIKFNKPVVMFQSTDETLRRSAEDSMAKRIPNSTPSYTLLSMTEAKDVSGAKAKVTTGGFDGAIVARLVSTDRQTTYVPGSTYWGPAPYGSMWGYYGYGWGAVSTPGYIAEDTVVTLESNVYSVAQDKLLWSSRSQTFNPTSVTSLIDSVIDASVAAMKKQGVL